MMGTKRDAQGKASPAPAPKSGDEIVVASDGDPRSHKKLFIAGAILLIAVLIAVVAWWFMSQGSDGEEVTLKSGSAVTGQVSSMTEQEVESVVNRKVDVNEDFSAAHARALALLRQDKHKEALKVFEELVATGKAKYYVYVDYALAQAQSSKLNEAVKTLEQAMVMLNADNSISSDVKASESRYLNNTLVGLKEEASL